MKILFLCTGNSCRSQMAEGWGRHLAGSDMAFDSAGIEAHGQNPRAIAVMEEVGIDIRDQHSTRLSSALLDWADRVVTVCGHADENCPMLPPGTEREHWPLEDPARATGSEEAVMATFRATRDKIEERVRALVARLADSTQGKGG